MKILIIVPNISDLSGALFTLRIQYEHTQTQSDDGARDGIDIWYMGNWGLYLRWTM